jgi:hypothetical protein
VTQYRHATIREQVDDLCDRLLSLGVFASVSSCAATELNQLLDAVDAMVALPGALVLVGDADWSAGGGSLSATVRTVRPHIVVVGSYSAAADAGADTVWDLVDRVARSFQPALGAQPPVVIDGVYYSIRAMSPVPAGGDRAAYSMELEAVDAADTRSDVD